MSLSPLLRSPSAGPAKALASEDGPRSQSLMLSAQRTLRAAGAELEWVLSDVSGGDWHERPTLDHASALVDCAGYPQVLAREVFALLKSAAVASCAALIVSNGAAVRVIVTTGWSDDEARAAAIDRNSFRIDCGLHRDETSEIVGE